MTPLVIQYSRWKVFTGLIAPPFLFAAGLGLFGVGLRWLAAVPLAMSGGLLRWAVAESFLKREPPLIITNEGILSRELVNVRFAPWTQVRDLLVDERAGVLRFDAYQGGHWLSVGLELKDYAIGDVALFRTRVYRYAERGREAARDASAEEARQRAERLAADAERKARLRARIEAGDTTPCPFDESTRIICRGFPLPLLKNAFTLGCYDATDAEVHSADYMVYGRPRDFVDAYVVEFAQPLPFELAALLLSDLADVAKNTDADIRIYCATDPANAITSYLGGERVCLYTSEAIEQDLRTGQGACEEVSLVAEGGRRAVLDTDTFISYASSDETVFAEPAREERAAVIEAGTYLYTSTEGIKAEYEEIVRDVLANGGKAAVTPRAISF